MKTAPKGCGKLIEKHNIVCGDHIDTGEFRDDVELVQPVLCDECWDEYDKKEKPRK